MISVYLHTDMTEESYVSFLATFKKNMETVAKNKKISGNHFSRVIMNSPTAEMEEGEPGFAHFTAHMDKDRALNNAAE